MHRIGINFLDEAERLNEFEQAELHFLSNPTRVKMSRKISTTQDTLNFLKHSYIKRSDGKIFAIAHDTKPTKFYTTHVTTVTDVDCFVWYSFKLYYISSSGNYRQIHIEDIKKFQEKFKSFYELQQSPLVTLSASEVKSLFALSGTKQPREGAVIGKGGFGKVKFAMDRDGQLYALKITHDMSANEAFIAKKIGLLEGAPIQRTEPNIVKYYYTLKWLGVSLSKKIENHSLSFMQKLSIAKQLCEKLSALHQAGFAHGDIKPLNIVVNEQNHVELIDFGLSLGFREKNVSTRTFMYLPDDCYALKSKLILSQINTYDNLTLDYIALQKTLHHRMAGQIDSLLTRDEVQFLDTAVTRLLDNKKPTSHKYLSILANAFEQQSIPPNEEDIYNTRRYFEKWASSDALENKNIYKLIMRQLDFILTMQDFSVWEDLLDAMTKMLPKHQKELLPLFTHQLRKTILNQSDPSFMLKSVSRLHKEVKINLFTQTDCNKNNLFMLVTQYSFVFAHHVWQEISAFETVIQEKILMTVNIFNKNALSIAMINSLPNLFRFINFTKLSLAAQQQIFSLTSNSDSFSPLLACIKQCPTVLLECLSIIQFFDEQTLSKIFTDYFCSFNILSYCIIDYPKATPLLLDLLDKLNETTQRNVWINPTPSQKDPLCFAVVMKSPFLSRIELAVQRLAIEDQMTTYKNLILDRLWKKLKKQSMTFKHANIHDIQTWCDFAETVFRDNQIELFLYATTNNVYDLILMANQHNFPGSTRQLLSPTLLLQLTPEQTFSLLTEPDEVFGSRLFYFISHYPSLVPILLRKIMTLSLDDDTYVQQCSNIASKVFLSGMNDSGIAIYSGSKEMPIDQRQQYDENLVQHIYSNPSTARLFNLLLMSTDISNLKDMSTAGDEHQRLRFINLYERSTLLYKKLRMIFLAEPSVLELTLTQKNNIQSDCLPIIEDIKANIAFSEQSKTDQKWRYQLRNRLEWLERLINPARYMSQTALWLFPKSASPQKRKLEPDNIESDQQYLRIS